MIALLVSYGLNKAMLRILRENAVIISAPVIEELIKTLPAYFLNRPIWHVHFFFGLGEALYDLITGNKESGKWAALISIISHSAFGGVTWLVNTQVGSIIPAVSAAIALHLLWNYLVMSTRKKR